MRFYKWQLFGDREVECTWNFESLEEILENLYKLCERELIVFANLVDPILHDLAILSIEKLFFNPEWCAYTFHNRLLLSLTDSAVNPFNDLSHHYLRHCFPHHAATRCLASTPQP